MCWEKLERFDAWKEPATDEVRGDEPAVREVPDRPDAEPERTEEREKVLETV